MKKPFVILAILLATFAFSPSADAHGRHRPSRHYVEYHRSCGGPAWVETYVAFHDCHGHPVFRTRVIPVRRVVRHRHHAPPAYCPPPRSGVSMSFHYGR